MTASSLDCAMVEPKLAEFALGLLGGRERSMVLEHVATCVSCRDTLERLSSVGDRLVALAPLAEPPLGFESRLMTRYHAASPHRTPRARRSVAFAGAALVLVVVGFSLGFRGSQHQRPSPTAYDAAPISAALTSQGQNRGQLWITSGSSTWIYMSLNDGQWSGVAWCRVTLKSGRVLDVGVFDVHRGYGAWAARVDARSASITSAQVTDATGRVLASAVVSA